MQTNKRTFTALALAASLLFSACGTGKKKTGEEDKSFPAKDFILDQVARVDTSMYSIRRIIQQDTLPTDTSFITREQFRDAARDFLAIPDISDPEFEGRYVEDKKFDPTINRAWFVYLPVKPANEEIQREEVLIGPEGTSVTNIIINTIHNSKDSVVEKKMLWSIDKSFQVITTRQLPGKPETVTTLQVLWNGDEGK